MNREEERDYVRDIIKQCASNTRERKHDRKRENEMQNNTTQHPSSCCHSSQSQRNAQLTVELWRGITKDNPAQCSMCGALVSADR